MMGDGHPRHRRAWWPFVLAVAVIALACSDGGPEEPVTVFAAASLRTVVAELESAWLAEHPASPLVVATEASNVLAAQIREGAPADVFLSADTARPVALARQGYTAAAPRAFARNRVALVVPAREDAPTSAVELARPGVRIVGASEGAPIARYTAETVARLARTMPHPARFAAAVEDNIVTREDNVRAALAKVELGEGDAAFVYVTDARGSDRVRSLPLPAAAVVTARYAAVQVSDRPAAAHFMAWLTGPDASAIIEAAGFETPA